MGGRGALVGAGVLIAATVTLGVAARHVHADPPVTGNPGGVAQVVAGSSVTCAALASATGVGTVKCWGDNFYGQLGRNNKVVRGTAATSMDSLGAIALGFQAGDGVAEVAVGGAHVCARSSAGAVICWGYNSEGQLGLGTTVTTGDGAGEMATLNPLDIAGHRLALQVVAGAYHSCIRAASKDVFCWGDNTSGQLGLGDTASRGNEPHEMAALEHVPLGGPVTHVASGANHVCALMESGAVRCWGDNGSGQLGLGDTHPRGTAERPVSASLSVPLPLGAGDSVSALSAGGAHTCALTAEGAVWCWGDNLYGQLGLGDTHARGDGPNEIVALSAVDLPAKATQVSAGHEHTCALLVDRTVRCWGLNSQGRLGYGDEDDQGDEAGEISLLAAVPMFGSRTVASVSAGHTHTCVRRDNGTVICWGYNASGQLGQNNTQTRGDDANEVHPLPPIVLTPPAVSLAAVAATSTTATAVFDLSADEPIDCASVSDTLGEDVSATFAASLTVTAHAPDTCRLTVVSTVAEGDTATVTMSRAAGFAVNDATGQSATSPALASASVLVDRAVPPTSPSTSPSTVPSTSPSTTPSTTPSSTPSTVPSVAIESSGPGAPATSVVTAQPGQSALAPLVLRVGRRMRVTRVLNRAAVSATSLARVWLAVRPASKRVCALGAGAVIARRAGRCHLSITVVGRGGRTTGHSAVLRVVRR